MPQRGDEAGLFGRHVRKCEKLVESMEHSFMEILWEHRKRYPLMEPQDYGKLIFQSVYGPEHMITDVQEVRAYMAEEFSHMAQDALPKVPEDIGNGLCRFPLCACPSAEAAELLADLFVLTAGQDDVIDGGKNHTGLIKRDAALRQGGVTDGGKKLTGLIKRDAALEQGSVSNAEKKSRLSEELQGKLEQVKTLGIPGMEAWVQQWKEKGYPAVHHSRAYREAYHPHYRLLRKEYAVYFPVLWEIYQLAMEGKRDIVKEHVVLSRKQEAVSGQEQEAASGRKQEAASGQEQEAASGRKQEAASGQEQGTASGQEQTEKRGSRHKGPVIVGMDGRCGSGKTSLAELIAGIFPCNVVHTDDFYLPMEEREENWTEIPGGNMDFARLHSEILIPARSGDEVLYRPYCCQEGAYGEALRLAPCPLLVVEGSYSHYPLLAEAYDLKVFLTCSQEVQKRRLQEREGSYFTMFEKRWIPMEENYFHHFDVEAGSDLVVRTG